MSMVDGDLMYLPLYGAREEDRSSVITVCGILKKFASDGVKETKPINSNIETFFHGMDISFKGGGWLQLYIVSQGKLGMSGGTYSGGPSSLP